MQIGAAALLIAAFALAAPLATAAPARADFKIGLTNASRAAPSGMFNQGFGQARRLRSGRVIGGAGGDGSASAAEEAAPAPARRADRPERPRLHGVAGEEAEDSPPEVTVVRPIGQRVTAPEQ